MTLSASTIGLLIDAGLSGDTLKTILAAIESDVTARNVLREHVTLSDAGSVTPAALRMRKMRENRRLLANNPPSEQTVTERNAVTSQGVTSYNNLEEEKGSEEESKAEESKPVVVARSPRKVAYSEQFQKFWTAFPTDGGMSKLEAWKAWQKLSEPDRELAISAIPNFIKWAAAQGATYRIVHACRYLSQHRFDGWSGSDGRQNSELPGLDRQAAIDFLRS